MRWCTVYDLMHIKDMISEMSVVDLEDLIEYANQIRDIRTTDINDTVDWIDKQKAHRNQLPWVKEKVSLMNY